MTKRYVKCGMTTVTEKMRKLLDYLRDQGMDDSDILEAFIDATPSAECIKILETAAEISGIDLED